MMSDLIRKKLKKAVIVAHALSAGGGVSVGKNLIRILLQSIPNLEYLIFVPEGLDYQSCIPEVSNVTVKFFKKTSLLQRYFFDNIEMESLIKDFKPDLAICLGNRAIKYKKCMTFLLCHDAHLFYPPSFYARELLGKKIIKSIQRYRLAQDLKITDVLFCQTRVAADRFKTMYGYSGDVRLLPNAVSVDVMNSESNPQMPDIYNKAAGMLRLFYLTRYYPHKNIEILVELFLRYGEQLQNVCIFITIAADQHPLAKKLLKQIIDHKLDERIINIGPLPQSTLPSFFTYADALIMPTTLESFSGTYLEAMSFGCPILTSDLDFAHDICGDAALYFDPWNSYSLCQCIVQLRDNPLIAIDLKNKANYRLHKSLSTWEQNGDFLLEAVKDYFEF